ncbi:MAG: hypothetical protein KIT31_27380 [Deltaproteobacteria bacterium]|nr:hypothetical protein [Deltaproteobacteria bacterium]
MRSHACILALTLLVGCGGKKDDGKRDDGKKPDDKAKVESKLAGGCDRREKEGVCSEYHGRATADWVKKECPGYNAQFVEACPKEGAVGRCVIEAGNASETHTLYYAPQMSKEAFAQLCKPPDSQPRDP